MFDRPVVTVQLLIRRIFVRPDFSKWRGPIFRLVDDRLELAFEFRSSLRSHNPEHVPTGRNECEFITLATRPTRPATIG